MAVKVLSSEIKTVPRYPNIPIVADSLDFDFTAPTVAGDGVQFPVTGREFILIQNTAVGAQTFTVASVACTHGRTGDITTYSLDPNEFAWLPLGAKDLYGSADGTMTITMSDVGIKVAVLVVQNMV